jgi:hypothetical protein
MTSDVRWDMFSLASDADEENFFERVYPTMPGDRQYFYEMVSYRLSQYLAAMEEGVKFMEKLKTTLVECGVLVRSISSKLLQLDQFSPTGIHQDLQLELTSMCVEQFDVISLRTSEYMDEIEDLDLFSLRSVSLPEHFEIMMLYADGNVKFLRAFSSQLDHKLIRFSRFRQHLFRKQQGRLHSGIFFPVASRRVSVCANFIITSTAKPFPSFVIDIAPLFFESSRVTP